MAGDHEIYETLRFHVFLCLLASIFVSCFIILRTLLYHVIYGRSSCRGFVMDLTSSEGFDFDCVNTDL